MTVNPGTGLSQVSLPARPSFQNRVETVSFDVPGRYLVICTVLSHFNDRMIAWVDVGPSERDEHEGHGGR